VKRSISSISVLILHVTPSTNAFVCTSLAKAHQPLLLSNHCCSQEQARNQSRQCNYHRASLHACGISDELSSSSLTTRVLWKLSQGSKLRNVRIVPSSNRRWLLAENPMFLRADQAFGTVVISNHGEEDKKSRQSTTHRIRERLRKKQNQAPKWNYCCNEASCTLLTDIWRNTPCKSGYRRRCSRRSGKDCSMLRSPIVHSTKAMIPGYNQAPKWNYCCNEAFCTLLTDIWRERRNGNKIRHRNEIIVAMKIFARFLLTSEETHLVNRDIEGDVRDALVKITPCCVCQLSIQQKLLIGDL